MTSRDVPTGLLRNIHSVMVKIRTCDELIRTALLTGKVAVFYFPVAGHEAIAAGVSQSVQADDYVVASYRGLHQEIGKGAPMEGLLGEVLGRRNGFSGGRGGLMHICDSESGVLLTSGVVGAGLPLANGLAWASQVRGDGRVTVCSFGEGATNTGAFHEAMNLAAVWDLPVVFLCENNRYAETTRSEETYRCETIAARADGYGMPSETVDGFDPIAVYERVSAAIERARSGGGPTLVECTCFRYFGHYFGDPMVTVPQEELASALEQDPVVRFGAWLVESGSFTPEEVKEIEALASNEAQACFEVAIAAERADPAIALTGVYASPVQLG